MSVVTDAVLYLLEQARGDGADPLRLSELIAEVQAQQAQENAQGPGTEDGGSAG
jgi:hypothetical protein